MRRALLLTILGLLAALPAQATELDDILALLATRQHGHVEFIEQQFLKMLDHPLESQGELTYDAPDKLEKKTLKPRAETLALAGQTLTIERGKKHRVVDLRAYPQVQPFIESIRATLAGNRPALERLFHLEFSGVMARWTLTLVPLDAKVKQSVAQVRIEGARDALLKVEIKQQDGDRSLMTLRPAPTP